MTNYKLVACFVLYLLVVVYVQHDRHRIRYKRALFTTFVAPFIYPFGLLIITTLYACSNATSRYRTIRRHFNQGKQTP